MTIRNSMFRHVRPQVTSPGFVYVRNSLLDRILVSNRVFEVVGSLVPAIRDLPCALGVVAGNRRRGPYVSVTRNFAAVVEIVEHTKLPRQFVLIRRDVLAIHR